MSLRAIECGFAPLVDCAPLAIAAELGFATGEGVDLRLSREASWSALRDKLAFGRLDAAHMLAPTPVAMSMGLGGAATPLDALMTLSVNGTVVCVSRELAAAMRAQGAPTGGGAQDAPADGGAQDAPTGGGARDKEAMTAARVGRALIAGRPRLRALRIAAPFPWSMHVELLHYWLNALGLTASQDFVLRTVPPPRMADAMAAGEIDLFCVGEPWGSVAVARGVAELVLPGSAIWRFAPEKVLAARQGWAEREEDAAAALMRAVWRAAKWLSQPENRITASEILAQPRYIDVPAELIERALAGWVPGLDGGLERPAPRLIVFFDAAATFPWRSHGAWIATRLAARDRLDRAAAAAVGRRCFRADLYRAHLSALGADMPGASEKLEGALTAPTPVASTRGEMYLGPDNFFDGRVFDPDHPG